MREDKKMRYFLTGKSGTIGKYLSNEGHPARFDITKESEVAKWFQNRHLKNRSFLHLAAIVGESRVSKNFEYAKKVNVEGAALVAKMALQSEVSQFVFVSTSHVYKPISEKMSEEAEVEPQNSYASLKREAEEKVIEIFKNNSSQLTILRIFSVLDYYADDFTLGGRVTKAIQNKERIKIVNSSDQRDFLTPRRVAEVIELCISKHLEGGIYNLCTGQPMSVKEAVQKMLVNASLPLDWFSFDEKVSAAPFVCGSNSKILNVLPEIESILRWDLSEFS